MGEGKDNMIAAMFEKEKPGESFNHSDDVKLYQVNQMIEDTHKLMEEHKRNEDKDKMKKTERLLKMFENQRDDLIGKEK